MNGSQSDRVKATTGSGWSNPTEGIRLFGNLWMDGPFRNVALTVKVRTDQLYAGSIPVVPTGFSVEQAIYLPDGPSARMRETGMGQHYEVGCMGQPHEMGCSECVSVDSIAGSIPAIPRMMPVWSATKNASILNTQPISQDAPDDIEANGIVYKIQRVFTLCIFYCFLSIIIDIYTHQR